MRAREPGPREHSRLALPPKFQHPRETASKQRREGFRSDLAGQGCPFAVGQYRRARQIDAESDCNPLAVAFKQNPRELLASEHRVVGPFQHQRLTGRGDVYGLDEGQSCGKRQRLCRRIASAQLDQRAAEEIARSRNPGAALASPACLLLERNQPATLNGIRIGEQVDVGRTGALDDIDTAQNRLPAALSVKALSGPISKYPTGEIRIAANKISAP